MGWKPPAIPDINPNTIIPAIKAMKEILEMRNGMRGTLDAVGFVKVWNMSECPVGANCVDRYGNVLIRGSLNVAGVDFNTPTPLYRKAFTAHYDTYLQATWQSSYDGHIQKLVESSFDVYQRKRVRPYNDTYLQTVFESAYDIIRTSDEWATVGDRDLWGDGDSWSNEW